MIRSHYTRFLITLFFFSRNLSFKNFENIITKIFNEKNFHEFQIVSKNQIYLSINENKLIEDICSISRLFERPLPCSCW